MKKNIATTEVTISDATTMPEYMREHVRAGGKLYLVGTLGDVSVISAGTRYVGNECTCVPSYAVSIPGDPIKMPKDRDLSFIKVGETVWHFIPKCYDVPVRQGSVEAIYPDGSVELWDDHLGEISSDVNHIFATEEAARAAYAKHVFK